jgi:hypothetical protein
MKRILAYSLLVLMIVSFLGLSGPVSYAEAETPAVYSIPYPENYPTAEDEEGASAFAGSLDHPQSDYYVVNDFHNMHSGGTLHILSGFDTYQQTTEYTCGTESPYDDVLILADPYDITDHFQDGYYTYPLGRFFSMWREGPCAQKLSPYEQPYVCAQPA